MCKAMVCYVFCCFTSRVACFRKCNIYFGKMPLWHCIYSCFCHEVLEYASIGVKKWAKLCAVSLVCVYFCVKREYILHFEIH